MSVMVVFMVAYIRGRQRPQGVYNVREEWFVMSVADYIRDGLFVRDGLCFLVLQSPTHSLTHSLNTNPGLISGSDGRHPVCYADEQYQQYTIFLSYVREDSTYQSPDEVVYE